MHSAGLGDFVKLITFSILLLAIGSDANAPRLIVPTGAKLSLTVYIQAGIGDSSLSPIRMRAQGVVSGMFATAGVHIDWRTGQPKTVGPEPPIVIEITSNTPQSFRRGVLAYAYPFEGVHIRIFYDRLRNPERPRTTAMLLAHVMVHEIAHILEGVDRHSAEGLMKASWTPHDLVQMTYKPLQFDPEDVLLIRKGFARREQAVIRAPLGLMSATRPSE
jgi:hypothetical protein